MDTSKENIYKILFLGDSAVGKTTFKDRYTNDYYVLSDLFIPTKGIMVLTIKFIGTFSSIKL